MFVLTYPLILSSPIFFGVNGDENFEMEVCQRSQGLYTEDDLMKETTRLRLSTLRDRIVEARLSRGNWTEMGDITGLLDIIRNHSRLLRSLDFSDDDYDGNVYDVLRSMHERDSLAISKIEQFVLDHLADGSSTQHMTRTISSTSRRGILVNPIEEIHHTEIDDSLVSVMMPYDQSFEPVWQAIKEACEQVGLNCQRVKDIWERSKIIQDVFNLLYRSSVVIADFSGKNPNVLYEVGIAHAFGRAVIPIIQSIDDVPFNLQTLRFLLYLRNSEGLAILNGSLVERLNTLFKNDALQSTQPVDDFDDDIPF